MENHFIVGKMYEWRTNEKKLAHYVRFSNNLWTATERRGFYIKNGGHVVVLAVHVSRSDTDIQILADNGSIGWITVNHVYIQDWTQVSD